MKPFEYKRLPLKNRPKSFDEQIKQTLMFHSGQALLKKKPKEEEWDVVRKRLMEGEKPSTFMTDRMLPSILGSKLDTTGLKAGNLDFGSLMSGKMGFDIPRAQHGYGVKEGGIGILDTSEGSRNGWLISTGLF